MIPEQEKRFISSLARSSEWHFIEDFAKRIVDDIKEENTIRDSEWDTLKFTLQKEGKIEGIKRLLQEMFNIASQ